MESENQFFNSRKVMQYLLQDCQNATAKFRKGVHLFNSFLTVTCRYIYCGGSPVKGLMKRSRSSVEYIYIVKCELCSGSKGSRGIYILGLMLRIASSFEKFGVKDKALPKNCFSYIETPFFWPGWSSKAFTAADFQAYVSSKTLLRLSLLSCQCLLSPFGRATRSLVNFKTLICPSKMACQILYFGFSE